MRWDVVAGAAVLSLLAAADAVAVWWAWQLPWSQADRLSLVGALLTGSTVALAVIAGLVALAAYAHATQRPHLVVEVAFRFSFPNRPVLELAQPDDLGGRAIAPYRQCEATVRIHNRSSYSARNPAVRIDLIGMGGIAGSTDWMPIRFVNTVGPTGVQWEGGADLAIHGHWTRELPKLDFAGVRCYPNQPTELLVDLVADGFHRETRLPVKLLESAEYAKYSEQRAQEIERIGSG